MNPSLNMLCGEIHDPICHLSKLDQVYIWLFDYPPHLNQRSQKRLNIGIGLRYLLIMSDPCFSLPLKRLIYCSLMSPLTNLCAYSENLYNTASNGLFSFPCRLATTFALPKPLSVVSTLDPSPQADREAQRSVEVSTTVLYPRFPGAQYPSDRLDFKEVSISGVCED